MKSINNTYRIIALTMAFVMFATTVNLAIDMHYCQGKLQNVSFFGKAETCHDRMATKMKNCPNHQMMMEETSSKEGCSMSKKDCCDNRLLHIQSDLDQLDSSSEFVVSTELQQFVIAFVAVFFKNDFIEKSTPNFQYYHPPIVVKDIPVLNQSFLL